MSETLAYLIIAAVLAHGLGEWRGELASWSRMVVDCEPDPLRPFVAPVWLELGLPIFATIWNGATIAAGLVWPAYQSALWGIAAGGMLADALAIHVAGRWRFGHWPPGSIPTWPLYLVAGGAWAWWHPTWWLALGALPFLPYWPAVRVYGLIDEALDKVAAEAARGGEK